MTKFEQPGFAFVVTAPGHKMIYWLVSLDPTQCDAWLAKVRGVESKEFSFVYDEDDDPETEACRLVIYGDDALFGLKLEERLQELFGEPDERQAPAPL